MVCVALVTTTRGFSECWLDGRLPLTQSLCTAPPFEVHCYRLWGLLDFARFDVACRRLEAAFYGPNTVACVLARPTTVSLLPGENEGCLVEIDMLETEKHEDGSVQQ